MKKNRILALTGAACLSVALLAGCGSNNNTDPSANSAAETQGLVVKMNQQARAYRVGAQ